ncbi:sensor histidine kinase [Pseudonocardia sp. GCM10023141]|uniref:sensor histidine kinase n=1 Tax=Pseudonocardia sp. GCM10023141 TaxID=3252653 RepID=UPI0036146484
MTPRGAGIVGRPLWTLRRARLALFLLHLPPLAVSPVLILFGLGVSGTAALSWESALPVLPAVAIMGVQLRHSFAAARGQRPRWWGATFALLVGLVTVPMLWLASDWLFMWIFLVASALMLLPAWVGLVGWLAMIVQEVHVETVVTPALDAPGGAGTFGIVESVVYGVLLFTVAIAALYGSTQLIRMISELYAGRAEIAELSVTAERLRIARDLHDLLGQSLSAVSLKGDLATALLSRDPAAARAEIESLTVTARTALRDVRAVATTPDAMNLTSELDGSAALLAAAGIDVTVDVAIDGIAAPVREALGWVVREGVTNIVRHSEAQRVTISGRREGNRVRLTLLNDGAGPGWSPGNGIDGLRARAGALGGSLHAQRRDDGWFVLSADVPIAPQEDAR